MQREQVSPPAAAAGLRAPVAEPEPTEPAADVLPPVPVALVLADEVDACGRRPAPVAGAARRQSMRASAHRFVRLRETRAEVERKLTVAFPPPDGVVLPTGVVQVPIFLEPLQEFEVVLHFAVDEAVDWYGLLENDHGVSWRSQDEYSSMTWSFQPQRCAIPRCT